MEEKNNSFKDIRECFTEHNEEGDIILNKYGVLLALSLGAGIAIKIISYVLKKGE